jgi:hypothetical protein
MSDSYKDAYNFYKNSSKGFVTKDGYAVVPYGKKQYMIIFDGQQLETVNTELQAKKFIKKHRELPKTGTVFVPD